jgi:hypothetical protein
MFTECSLNVHQMFTKCSTSQVIRDKRNLKVRLASTLQAASVFGFTECSLNVH